MTFSTSNYPDLMTALCVRIGDNDPPKVERPLEVFDRLAAPDPDKLGDHDVIVRLVASGACVTNREIFDGFYGHGPIREETFVREGTRLDGWLATGHEGLFRVMFCGRAVTNVAPGDLVVATVRPGCGRPECWNCSAGHPNRCISGMATLHEMGIHFRHGTDVEYKVFASRRLRRVKKSLGLLGLLAEPFSIAAHAKDYSLKLWRVGNPGLKPGSLFRNALVLGNGPIGLSIALEMRLLGIPTLVVSRSGKGSFRGKNVTDLGVQYLGLEENGVDSMDRLPEFLRAGRAPLETYPCGPAQQGGFDAVFEATGSAFVVAQTPHLVSHGGIVIATSITGGGETVEYKAAEANLFDVLGNGLRAGIVNAHGDHFDGALEALEGAEKLCPGWGMRLLTHPHRGGIMGCMEMLKVLKSPPQDMFKLYATVDGEFE